MIPSGVRKVILKLKAKFGPSYQEPCEDGKARLMVVEEHEDGVIVRPYDGEAAGK